MDCGCDSPKTPLIPYEQALQNLLDHAVSVTETENAELLHCLNRVLAEDVTSAVNVPPLANSSMDGYAVRCADIQPGQNRMVVSQRIPAGAQGESLEPGTAARIFTGAPIPDGADAVIMQEQVVVDGDAILFESQAKAGQNIREAGEDIRVGQVILPKGKKLLAQDMGLAASIGRPELKVYRKLRVGIFFTGDELVEPGQPLAAGKIYDSNRYTLNGLLETMNCEVMDLGIVGDTLEQTLEVLQHAAQQTDLVITSGGVSVGEEDHIRAALEQLGELKMWRVKIKPGKPFVFGQIEHTPFIGLPGNPVSVYAGFCWFVSLFLRKLQGRDHQLPGARSVIADFDWSKPDTRREFARARLSVDSQQQWSASLYPNQSSGVLMSTSWADGFVVIPEDSSVQKGDPIAYYSFNDFLD